MMSWLLAETVVYTTIESKDGVFGWTEHEGLHWATETRARKHFQNMVKVFLAAEISMSRYALEQHRPRTSSSRRAEPAIESAPPTTRRFA